MSSPSTPTSEKIRELCVRLEADQDVEFEAMQFIRETCGNLQVNPDLEIELNALLNLLTERLYTRFTDSYLQEATKADDGASWWSFLEQASSLELIWYLLQSRF